MLLYFGIALKVLLLLFVIFLLGLAGSAVFGPWGWVVGPFIAAAVHAAIAGIILGMYRFGEWWKARERAYLRNANAAHGDGRSPAS